MTIQEKAIRLCNNEDAHGIFKFLDKIPEPTHLPFMVNIKSAGMDSHRWAWDALEDWQNNDEPTWIVD